MKPYPFPGSIPGKRVLSFLGAQISAVTVDSFFFAGQQFRHHCDVVGVGSGHLNGVCQTAVLVYADMGLVSEMPSISLLYRMGIRVPHLLLILRGGRGQDNHRIHECSLFQNETFLHQRVNHLGKQLLLDPVVLQNVAESSQGIPVWHMVAGIHAAEFRKGEAVYNLCHGRHIGEVIQVLNQRRIIKCQKSSYHIVASINLLLDI